MAGYLPPGFPFFPPPPPRSAWPPPPPPLRRTSPTSNDNSSASPGGVIAGVAISVGAFLLVLTFVCSLCQGYRNSRANATADAAAAAAVAALAARGRAPALLPPVAWDDDDENDEQRLRGRGAGEGGSGRPAPRASPAAGLPSFTYNRSVRHNVTSGGEEGAATCSVCLGGFQTGETVRLLPLCLHLFHVECIDPWLDAHSTCPICRSGTDPDMDGSLLPPV